MLDKSKNWICRDCYIKNIKMEANTCAGDKNKCGYWELEDNKGA